MRFPVLAVSALALLLGGCAKTIDPSTYTEQGVGEITSAKQGVILNVRDVTVKTGDKLEENGMGILLGGVAGGLGGNEFGAGSGRTAATIGGVVLGSALGALAQNAAGTQPGVEYIVKVWDAENVLTTTGKEKTENRQVNRVNERLLTIVQGPTPRFQPGQQVFVITGANSQRARLIADQNVSPQVNQTVIESVVTVGEGKK